MAEKMVIAGTRQKRFDGYDMVTGRAQYVADMIVPHMLYAKCKVSPYAHAEVVSIDTSKAKALPGVKAIITGKDVAGRIGTGRPKLQKVLTEKARKVNDPVAAVAATTPEIAQQAVDLIEVTYKVLPHVMEIDEASKADVNLVHTGERPEGSTVYGDVDKGFKEAEVILDGDYWQHWIHPMEPERTPALASWNKSEGSLTIWTANQCLSGTQDWVAEFLKIPASKVRAIVGYTGGSYGSNPWPPSNKCIVAAVAALLSQMTGQAVMFEWDDLDSDICMLHGRNEIHYDQFRMGCKSDGTITALQVHSMADAGAQGAPVYSGNSSFLNNLLLIPHLKDTYGGVYTNKLHHESYRGVGTVPSQLALELHGDRMAEKLGMNPLDFWLKNAVKDGSPVGSPTGLPNASCALTECLLKAAAKTDYRAKWHKPGEKTLPDGRKHGIAIVPYTHGSGSPYRSGDCNAYVKVLVDGSIQVATGVQDQGQYTREAMAIICAEVFKISSLARIQSTIGDTEATPYGPSSTGTKVTTQAGVAVVKATEEVKKQLFAMAAPLLKVDASALDTAEHVVFEKAKPDNKITFAEVLAKASPLSYQLPVAASAVATVKNTIRGFGADVAEVAVDTDTGKVEVTNYTVFTDCGRVLNRIAVEQQFHGGVQQGIGYALYEGFQYDPATGKLLNTDFLGYKTFGSLDMPPMYVEPVEPIDKLGPLGAKGIGETATVGPGGCILNAIYNAIGVRFNHNTLTTRDILKALGKA